MTARPVKPPVKPPPPVRFVKQYTNFSGRVFRRYQADDGRIIEVRVRDGRWTSTNAEAKQEAIRRLATTEDGAR